MAKRKYTRFGETATQYECTKRKCKWQGTDEEKLNKRTDPVYQIFTLVCPNCGNDEFYGLLSTENLLIMNNTEVERDDLFTDAARLIVSQQKASSAMLQLKLKLGYQRANRIMNQLKDAKIISGSSDLNWKVSILSPVDLETHLNSL